MLMQKKKKTQTNEPSFLYKKSEELSSYILFLNSIL